MKDTRYDTREAAGADLEETPVLVKWLCHILTPELVAHLAASRETDMVRGWASGWLVPSGPEENRLRFAYTILRRTEDLQGREAAQAWFMAVNSRLGQRSPLKAIREGRFHETAAAKKLLEGAREA